MTTETTRDPVIEAWSDRLEEELVEAGMDRPQARAYRQAFELGLTRVISQTATRQELQDGLAATRQELQDGLAATRQELQDGLAENRRELRQGLSDLRREMAEMQDGLRREMDGLRREMGGLRREMDVRFAALEKRLNLLAWAIGLGFTGIFGVLAAILAAILTRL